MRVLLAVICLLSLATSASAECAWVRWHHSDRLRFELLGASATMAECVKELDRKELREGAAATRSSSPVLYILEDRTSTSEMCLPDMVGPRGPKGK
jgi:hypothetical protein